MSEKYPDLLAWVDIETTGLEAERDEILELGIILTDGRLNEISRASWVIKFDRGDLPRLDDWCLQQHAKSGLLVECFKSEIALDHVEKQAIIWLNSRSSWAKRVPAAGASVHFDRGFLNIHMPDLNKWFHYGNLDVSSIEKLARLWHPVVEPWKDRGLHRALPDCEDAIAELAYYREQGIVTESVNTAYERHNATVSA